jgi:predicted Zn-dependent peptidase
MKRYEDEPAAKVEEAYHQMLYRDTKLGMRIIGEEKSLRSVAAAELFDYHKRWYQPQKMVIIIAGKIEENAKQITEKVEEWFGKLPKAEIDEMEVVTPAQSKPELVVITKPDASQAHLTLGIRAFARGSKDRFAWNLFNLIMGVSFTSRLFKEVREKRGLCYHVRSGSSAYADVGSWDIYAGVATDKVEEATRAILAELTKVKESGVTDEELAIAKKRLTALFSFKGEDPEFFTEWFGRAELFGMPLLTLDDYIQKIAAVTKDEINTLAKKYLRTETLNMALVWNKPRDEKLVSLLSI